MITHYTPTHLDLEFLLRSYCQKIRVVERLYGEAHLLITKVANTISSLAIRVCETEDESDDATVAKFFDSFQMAVVFFVLPTKHMHILLDDINSSFHRAQRLARPRRSSNSEIKASGVRSIQISTMIMVILMMIS